MKCKECDVPSIVRMVGEYHVEDGGDEFWNGDVRHVHDPNPILRHYLCSNGHFWVETELIQCPSCGSEWRP